jgi:hypothetical protein
MSLVLEVKSKPSVPLIDDNFGVVGVLKEDRLEMSISPNILEKTTKADG